MADPEPSSQATFEDIPLTDNSDVSSENSYDMISDDGNPHDEPATTTATAENTDVAAPQTSIPEYAEECEDLEPEAEIERFRLKVQVTVRELLEMLDCEIAFNPSLLDNSKTPFRGKAREIAALFGDNIELYEHIVALLKNENGSLKLDNSELREAFNKMESNFKEAISNFDQMKSNFTNSVSEFDVMSTKCADLSSILNTTNRAYSKCQEDHGRCHENLREAREDLRISDGEKAALQMAKDELARRYSQLLSDFEITSNALRASAKDNKQLLKTVILLEAQKKGAETELMERRVQCHVLEDDTEKRVDWLRLELEKHIKETKNAKKQIKKQEADLNAAKIVHEKEKALWRENVRWCNGEKDQAEQQCDLAIEEARSAKIQSAKDTRMVQKIRQEVEKIQSMTEVKLKFYRDQERQNRDAWQLSKAMYLQAQKVAAQIPAESSKAAENRAQKYAKQTQKYSDLANEGKIRSEVFESVFVWQNTLFARAAYKARSEQAAEQELAAEKTLNPNEEQSTKKVAAIEKKEEATTQAPKRPKGPLRGQPYCAPEVVVKVMTMTVTSGLPKPVAEPSTENAKEAAEPEADQQQRNTQTKVDVTSTPVQSSPSEPNERPATPLFKGFGTMTTKSNGLIPPPCGLQSLNPASYSPRAARLRRYNTKVAATECVAEGSNANSKASIAEPSKPAGSNAPEAKSEQTQHPWYHRTLAEKTEKYWEIQRRFSSNARADRWWKDVCPDTYPYSLPKLAHDQPPKAYGCHKHAWDDWSETQKIEHLRMIRDRVGKETADKYAKIMYLNTPLPDY